jgi:hypothetical protein
MPQSSSQVSELPIADEPEFLFDFEDGKHCTPFSPAPTLVKQFDPGLRTAYDQTTPVGLAQESAVHPAV